MSAPRLTLVLPFLALLVIAAGQDPKRAAVELELTYLANEGFLARVGDAKVLIDAFVTEPYAGYAAVPEELFADMVAGKPPFDGVELALTSHVHRDHFQPEPAALFLAAHRETTFLSAPHVVAGLLQELGGNAAGERPEALLPEARQSIAVREQEIGVELLRLAHSGGARSASVQNLGHVIDLAGAKLLHVGDADAVPEELGAYELVKRAVDVALVPYWWLGDAASLARAKELTGAKHLVAIHVPPAELADVKQHLAALDPAVLVFEEPGESRSLSLAGK
jgi:L-ascorbate metabolism protein UlaG (beta-lactamase superfamily)